MRSLFCFITQEGISRPIRDSLGDRELADRMCFIKRGISAEALRQELLNMVQTRIGELKVLKPEVFPSSECNKDGLCLS